MATWQDVVNWVERAEYIRVERSSGGGALTVTMAWTDGRSQWAMVTNHSFGGSQCVGLRSLIVPLKPDDDAFARNQAANILLAMTPERQTDVPFGLIVIGDAIWMSTALLLQGLTWPQLEFALTTILTTSDALQKQFDFDL